MRSTKYQAARNRTINFVGFVGFAGFSGSYLFLINLRGPELCCRWTRSRDSSGHTSSLPRLALFLNRGFSNAFGDGFFSRYSLWLPTHLVQKLCEVKAEQILDPGA